MPYAVSDQNALRISVAEYTYKINPPGKVINTLPSQKKNLY